MSIFVYIFLWKIEWNNVTATKVFFNTFNEKHIRTTDWKIHCISGILSNESYQGKYHDLYINVLSLSDVCENIRKRCFKYYELNSCHDTGSPELSWDSVLKIAGAKLELFSNIDMNWFFVKRISGSMLMYCS